MFTSTLIAAAVGYVLGSLPFGYLVARARGVDIFAVGSKNPGATNVRRVLGRGPGNLVFVLDVLKGALATGWPMAYAAFNARRHAGEFYVNIDPTVFMIAGLVGAVLGHSFSCFTKFRGGKGVATGAGGFLVLMPTATLIGAVVWGAVFLITRYVSLASMLAAVSLPLSAWWLGRPCTLIVLCVVVAVFVVVRHRENCRRLLHGTEHRFVKTPGDATHS